MLVNNPMGSRRRRRFYHRAGVVPIPGELSKEDFSDPNFYKYEMEPFEYTEEEEEFKPTSSFTANGKRRVNFITVDSLHNRLLDIIDSMIALAEAEDREKEKQGGAEEATQNVTDKSGKQATAQGIIPTPTEDIAQEPAKVVSQEVAEKANTNGTKSSEAKPENE